MIDSFMSSKTLHQITWAGLYFKLFKDENQLILQIFIVITVRLDFVVTLLLSG